MNNTDGGTKLPLNGEISAIIDDRSVSAEIEKIKSEYSSSESFLIDSMKKICGDGMSIGGETLPMLWELLKLAVAYEAMLDRAKEAESSDIIKPMLFKGYELRYFLSPAAFSPAEILCPVRYGSFEKLVKSFRIKREMSKRKTAFLAVLDELSVLENTLISDNVICCAFKSSRSRFSAKDKISDAIYEHACDISNAVKAILISRGVDILELGLLPIGNDNGRENKKSPFTYPV